MGDFRIEIEATGAHGCSRETKEGHRFYGCGKMGCPDCELRRFLASPQVRAGIRVARLIHWPGTAEEIVDEYRLIDGQFVQATRVKGAFE